LTSAVSNKYDQYIWWFIIGVTAVRMIMAIFLGVAPQEAYYWNYSKHLALSYFDHPPMTAYLIYFFTGIFGDNNFGVHFSAIFISFMLMIVIYHFVKSIFDSRVAFWTVIVGGTTIIFALGGLIITPDAPLLLFWMLGMFGLYQADKTGDIKWWLLGGIFLGCAMVSKYTAAFAILGALLYLVTSRNRLKHFASPGPYLAAILAAIVFLPVVIWNYQHDWASFGFQSSRRVSEAVMLRLDYFFGFLGTQIGILAIFLLPLFIWAIIKALKYLNDNARVALFFWFAVPTAVFFTLISPVVYVKMNWLAPAYLSALPLAVYFYFGSSNRFLKSYGKFAVIFSIAITVLVHVLVLFPNFTFGRGDTINGWEQLAGEVEKIEKEFPSGEKIFICGYAYKTASELRFHMKGHPETFSNSIVGRQGLAYDFWSNPDTLVGKNCIFVYDRRNSYGGDLNDYFARVEAPETLTIKRGGRKITDFYIYRCYNYRGIR
jgi:4-amino-4-deoxy-L-arabinose transferase-like glycosyltransferase